MAVTTKKQTVRGMTKAARLKELKYAVSMAFQIINEPDLKELAIKTQLCVGTLRKMTRGKFTLDIKVNTLSKIGVAAGCNIELSETGVKMAVVS